MRIGGPGRVAAGLAVALLIVVWGAAVLPRVVPGAGAPALTLLLGLAAVLGVATVALLRRSSRGFAVGPHVGLAEERVGFPVWGTALLAPLLGSLLLVIATVRSGFAAWAMQGDMVWNTAQSLFVHADGGVVPDAHPNPAPLTNILFALAYGPSAHPSLHTVLNAHGTVLVVIAAAASLMSGLYAAVRGRGLHPFVRVCLVFAVAWLPYTGALLGAVTAFGHANVLTSYLVLWLAWIVFGEGSLPPLLRCALLLCLSTVTIASWAPLVVVPLGLAIVAGALGMRGLRTQRAGAVEWIALATGFMQFAAYGWFVTLPDLRREGEALSQNGSALMISPQVAAVLLGVLGLAAVLLWWVLRGRPEAIPSRSVCVGVVAVLGFSVPALAYLMLQRAGMESSWGYYPVKYVMLLGLVLAGVMIATVAEALPRSAEFWRQTGLAALAVPLFLVPVLAPFGWFPGASAFAPGLPAAAAPLDASQRAGLDRLVQVYDRDPGARALLFDENDVWAEQTANAYLIQLSVERSSDPVRDFAYLPDRLKGEQLCMLLELWQGETIVYSSAAEGESAAVQRLSACGETAASIGMLALNDR